VKKRFNGRARRDPSVDITTASQLARAKTSTRWCREHAHSLVGGPKPKAVRRSADTRLIPVSTDWTGALAEGVAELLCAWAAKHAPRPSTGGAPTWDSSALPTAVEVLARVQRAIDERLPKPPTRTCRQCGGEYEPMRRDDGFCSDTCLDQNDAELEGKEG